MIIPSLTALLPFIQTQGYWIMFVLMFIEGPIVTYVASFASRLGYFNPLLVFILSVFGNFLPDMMYYAIGHLSRKFFLYKYFMKGIGKSKLRAIERGFNKHPIKAMVAIKLIPPLPPPGLIVAGMMLPFRKFLTLSLIISVAYSLFFFLFGFYSGSAYEYIIKYFKYGEIFMIVMISLAVIVPFLVKYFFDKEIKHLFKGGI